MIRGSCLCGTVQFQIAKAIGPFEFCHCNRCRKVSGASGTAALGVLAEDYELLAGRHRIKRYEAPILYEAPAYTTYFCERCGSPVPPADPDPIFEIAAGLLDDDPRFVLDKHIFVECLPPWDEITDGLPQYTLRQLYELRHGHALPDDFELRTHSVPPTVNESDNK